MKIVRRVLCPVLLAWFVAAPGAAAEPADPSSARSAELVYAIYIGGLHAVDVTIGLTLRDDSYSLDLSTEVTGLIGYLLPWSLRVRSSGRVDGERLVPDAAHTESSWRGKRRWTTLEYKDGRPVVVSATPGRKPHRVPAERLRGAIDPASAILSAARAAGSSCSIRVPIFDGRRRLDAVIEALGDEEMPRSGYSAYAGKAAVCDLRIEILHGRRRESDYGGLAGGEKTMTFWFARLFEGVHPLPVRIAYDTDLGWAIGHLTGARIAGTGQRVYRLPR